MPSEKEFYEKVYQRTFEIQKEHRIKYPESANSIANIISAASNEVIQFYEALVYNMDPELGGDFISYISLDSFMSNALLISEIYLEKIYKVPKGYKLVTEQYDFFRYEKYIIKKGDLYFSKLKMDWVKFNPKTFGSTTYSLYEVNYLLDGLIASKL